MSKLTETLEAIEKGLEGLLVVDETKAPETRTFTPEEFITYVAEQIERKTNFFTSLPLLSGHAMICSWWLELYEAAVNNDWRRVKKLYEAGLTITIRVRVGPSISQIVMDSISWSESVRTISDAGSDTLLVTLQRYVAVPDIDKQLSAGTINSIYDRF